MENKSGSSILFLLTLVGDPAKGLTSSVTNLSGCQALIKVFKTSIYNFKSGCCSAIGW